MTQPSLLDLPAPSAKPNPVKVERDRLNAAALRVLAYLERHGEATNVELCRPEVGGNRGIGRLWEAAKRERLTVIKTHVKGGIWKYRVVKENTND